MNPPGTRTKERHDTTMATASDLIGGAGIIDCMIGFPASDFSQYEFIRAQLRDSESRDGFDFPVEYMFKNVPKELYGAENPIDITLHEMDRFGVERGLVGVGGDVSARALKEHPDRFIASGSVDPNEGMEGVRNMVRQYEEFGVRAFGAFPAGCNPQVAIDDAKFYPIYAKCVELDLPFCCTVGVPGPRIPMGPQKVELIDEVCWFFPELKFVMRHGAEPWTDLASKHATLSEIVDGHRWLKPRYCNIHPSCSLRNHWFKKMRAQH